jgi:hypothetical protein
VKAWLDGIAPKPAAKGEAGQREPPPSDDQLAKRVQELEERLRQLESKKP